jgi:hypothetical protein
MSRRAAVGVYNGNWRRAMRDETNEIIEASIERVREDNKDRFRFALSKLKSSDPAGWEVWYDNDDHVPNFILWTNTKMVNEIIARMEEHISAW